MRNIIKVMLTLTLVAVLFIPFSIPVSAADDSTLLRGRWQFENNLLDTSIYPYHNDGTFYGGRDRYSSGALSFDGSNDYVSVLDASSLDISGEITVEAWVKVNQLKDFNAVVVKGYDGTENYEILLTAGGLVHCPITLDSGSRPQFYSNGTITADVWHHIAMTYKSGDFRIYIDGVQDYSNTSFTGNPVANNYALTIGAEQNSSGFISSRYFDGYIDEVRIWNKALSQSQLGYYTTPSVNITSPANGATYDSNSVPSPAYTTQGQVFTGIVESGYSTDPGVRTYTVNVTDYWGNTASDSVIYTVVAAPSQLGKGRNAHFYKVVSTSSPLFWTAARDAANGLGSYTPPGDTLTYYPHLATITSSKEQTFIAGIAGANQNLWIGGTDNTTEGVWTWVTGERLRYTNWGAGEPNGNSIYDEDYMMWLSGVWRDYPDSGSNAAYGYIVEYEN